MLATPQLTVHEALGVLFYNSSLSESKFRNLCEWLGCYSYIHPDKRVIKESSFSIPPIKKSPTHTLHLYLFQIALEVHYTEQEQSHIIRHILCYQQPK